MRFLGMSRGAGAAMSNVFAAVESLTAPSAVEARIEREKDFSRQQTQMTPGDELLSSGRIIINAKGEAE